MINSFISLFGTSLGFGWFAVFIVSLTSFVGVFLFVISKQKIQRFLPYLVSISVGALLGDALLHLLPEAFLGTKNGAWVGIWTLVGFFGFLLLEHGLHWHHSHGEDEELHEHGSHIGGLVTIADSIHNMLDGVIIALGFVISIPLGIATTLAVVLHEIPQEFGDMGLLLYAGWSRKKALFFNFFSACFAFLGYAIVVLLQQYTFALQQYLPYFLASAAGGFIYIAGADLIPELRRNHRSDFAKHIIVIIVGVIAMASLLLLE